MFDSTQRRSSPRNKFACMARFRQRDMEAAEPAWLCVTRDFSHDGIYFLADDHGLQESMQLLLSFPYAEHSLAKDRQYLVEIMRIKRINSLFQDRCGVGARLILRMPMKRYHGLLVPEISSSKDDILGATSHHIDLYT